MKKMFIVALATLFSLSALADDYKLYIVAATAETSYDFSSLQKITFSNGEVVISMKSGENVAMPISSVSRMYFESVATGISSNRQLDKDVAWDGQSLSVKGAAGRVEIYQASGALVAQRFVSDGESISLSNLPRGIYVVKAGGRSFKIVKK